MRTSSGVTEDVTRDIKVLPYDQSLDGSEFKGLERVFDTKAVLARILTDFIKVLLDEPLFLDELDVRKRLGSEFDGLRTSSET